MDLDNAANDIRERVARVAGNLPTEAEPPQNFETGCRFHNNDVDNAFFSHLGA